MYFNRDFAATLKAIATSRIKHILRRHFSRMDKANGDVANQAYNLYIRRRIGNIPVKNEGKGRIHNVPDVQAAMLGTSWRRSKSNYFLNYMP